MLYPGYKWLLRVLRDAPDQPPGLDAAIGAVIASPGTDTVDALVALVVGFRDWSVADQHRGTKFMLDTELAWLHDRPPIGDL